MEDKDLAKLFYVANVFVFEETGKQTRERWQCGAELIGVSSPQADVELVMLALEVMKRLGISGIKLKLFHAGIIRALLAKLKLSPEEQAKIFDRILDGDAEALAKVELEEPELGKALPLLDLKGESSGFLKNLKALFNTDLPNLKPGIDDFINITGLLETMGCDYQIDIASGRGFEYYTGVIFQFFKDEEKLGGGGRYDALIPLMGGRDTPASGFALYLDRLMDLVKPESLAKPLRQRILVRAEPEATEEGFSLARRLHEAGYMAEFYLGVQKQADFSWTLDIKGKPPLFILTDQAEHRRFEAQTIKEVLEIGRAHV
jgi:histidyl-tRNA synthetase